MNYIKCCLRWFIYKIKYRNVNIWFHYTSKIFSGSTFDEFVKIGRGSFFKGHIGKCSYIGEYSKYYGEIGNFSSIGSEVEVITGVHPYKAPFVSTSPLFVSDKGQTGMIIVNQSFIHEFKYADENKKYEVIVGNDCWLGYKCSLVAGVTISDGAVVLSHALVTKNVPPYAIVGGIPAKIIGYRYDDDQIEELMKIQWWNWPLSRIIKNKKYFLNIDEFIENFKK